VSKREKSEREGERRGKKKRYKKTTEKILLPSFKMIG
jgi:hypothetical protein